MSHWSQAKESNRETPQRKWLRTVLAVHAKLIESLEWSGTTLNREVFSRELPGFVRRCCRQLSIELDDDEFEALAEAVLSETFGLGPLDTLLQDPFVSDVLVNHHDEVYIERHGRLIRTPICFADEAHLLRIIHRLAGRVGRRIDESSPMVDARLEDGSRVHAVIQPLALRGPTLSIRRFGRNVMQLDALVEHAAMSDEMAEFLRRAVEARVGILISGGTGAGKTTLLNAVSAAIGKEERIVTIEDAAELRLQHPHFISLETRPDNAEATGRVSIRDLVRTSLRMRPDRIIVGEVRGDEVLDMLQAMNTGHPGSMTTIHANSARDALSRLEMMIGLSGQHVSLPVLRRYIAAGIGLLVHVARLAGGIRRVTQIAELAGVKEGEYKLRELFRFEETGVDAQGVAIGEFTGRDRQPTWLLRRREKRLADERSVSAPPLHSPPVLPNGGLRFSVVSTLVERFEEDEDATIDESESIASEGTADNSLAPRTSIVPPSVGPAVVEPRFTLLSTTIEPYNEDEDDDDDQEFTADRPDSSTVIEYDLSSTTDGLAAPERLPSREAVAAPSPVDYGLSSAEHFVMGTVGFDPNFDTGLLHFPTAERLTPSTNRYDEAFQSLMLDPLGEAIEHVALLHSARRG